MNCWRRTALAALLMLAGCRQTSPSASPATAKPELFLLTSLQLVWSERFVIDQAGSPALKALEKDYRITPIDLPSQLPDGALLLAAQPRALPAEELVALDAWVRRGGRLLLLADPLLEWQSSLPLGDPRRPPIDFPDTGLLRHWGLRLDAPDERGPKQIALGGAAILAGSPGMIVRTGGTCEVADHGLLARCGIGKGRASVIADADFLDLGPEGLDGPTDANLPALLSQLAALVR